MCMIQGGVMNKILTISIAAYNVEETLDRALKSIFNDITIADKLEVIIENDGSSDGTQTIAESYKQKYPKSVIVNNKRNGGYGSTINESIKLASGKYFKQLDGDDWFESDNLCGFIDYLSACEDDLIVSPHYIVNQDATSGKKYIVNTFNASDNYSINLHNTGIPGDVFMHSLAIKTELLKKHDVTITENCFYTDFEYVFYPFIYAESLSFYHLPIYDYLLGREGQSVSLTGEKKHYKDRIKVFMRVSEFYESNAGKGFLDKKIANLAADMYNSMILVKTGENQKNHLVYIDAILRDNYPYVYSIMWKRKSVAILRRLHFNNFSRSLVKIIIRGRYA